MDMIERNKVVVIQKIVYYKFYSNIILAVGTLVIHKCKLDDV